MYVPLVIVHILMKMKKEILKALKDIMDAFDSMKDLTVQERDLVMNILMNSIAASHIISSKYQ